MKPPFTILAMLLGLLASAPALAQEESSKLILNNFFQPDFVLSYAKEINLGPQEQKDIEANTDETLRNLRELRRKLQGEAKRLDYLSGQDYVPPDETLTCLRRILSLEGDIKDQQLKLLIKIKNILNPVQEEMLRKLPR